METPPNLVASKVGLVITVLRWAVQLESLFIITKQQPAQDHEFVAPGIVVERSYLQFFFIHENVLLQEPTERHK